MALKRKIIIYYFSTILARPGIVFLYMTGGLFEADVD